MNRHQMLLSTAAVAITAGSPLQVSAIESTARLENIPVDHEALMLAKKAAIFDKYRSAEVHCFISGSIDDEAAQEVAALLMSPGSNDWTRIVTYENGRDYVRIDAIRVYSDGELVKVYAEKPVALGQGDSLHIGYSPSSLWNSGGRIDGVVDSQNGATSTSFRTR
jgi:hypothetical protein